MAWSEAESPYRAVARITVPRQAAWSDARVAAIDDGLAFSPWHGLAAHRSRGAIMRARRATHPVSACCRAARNGGPLHEPASAAGLAV